MEDCFICLEPNSVINCREAAYTIQNKTYYFSCDCKIYTHAKCMQTWLEYAQKCPICRTKLPVYQCKLQFCPGIKRFCKALVKSCFLVFLIIIYLVKEQQEEMQKQHEINITFCRYIIINTTVKSI